MSRRAPATLPPLLPRPRAVRAGAGAFALRDGLPIVLEPGALPSDDRAAGVLRRAAAERCGVDLAVEGHADADDLGPRIELRRRSGAGLPEQGYRLSISPVRIEAVAGGAPGLRYAVETLRQLLLPDGRVPACEVEDAPDFRHRGVMLDVSRGKVPTPDAVREVIDACARLKLNVLMLYTEHTFRFRRHPQIGEGASPLDATAMRELDAYAAERFVELVPTLQSLGHMRHVLKIPDYRSLAETDRLWTLAPVDPGTYKLLADLYAEYLPNFRSSLFNANCDEPYDLGRGRSAERSRQLGPGGLFLEHVRRVRDLARAHGKRTLVWGDVVHQHPDRIAEIDRDLLLLDWWYEAQGDFDRVKRFAENGIEFWVCPGTSTWNCLFPRIENAERNVSHWAAAGRRHGATGLVNTDWGDHGHYNLQSYSWMGYAWGAQQSWSGDAEPDTFDRAFSRALFDDPSGKAARLYRELGAIHDVGQPVLNGSLLQFVFFDDPRSALWLVAGDRRKLRAAAGRLAKLREKIAKASACFAGEPLAHAEIVYAADASELAARKGLAGLDWLAWWRRPASLDARARRALARTLGKLADEQAQLGRRLKKLWLARAGEGGFEIAGGRLARSVRGLRAAARALERGQAPATAPPERFDFGTAYRALTASLDSGPELP
ncbi:MAG TPA: glycoside hydrolase family 20 zincin-like fold domain-containing protein [Myxococcota bacterium]|nr:glycoside hydrolase family 20 zincin-like fold domain-containing protein [Myxococcota bacterium]